LRILRRAVLLAACTLLSGCNMVLMNPSGDVAVQQRDLLITSTLLMLLIIVPVMALTVLFAWRYRHTNHSATYSPDWHHSTRLEVAIWAAPLAIIVALGALTWISTHMLDPYRQIARIGPSQPLSSAPDPVTVDVVALDWKWLFIYPSLHIATVNELAAPVNTPINFQITASSVMNSFFIPALAGQVYAMPGMQTQLHAVINKPGDYQGFSANYSGAGFSDMTFTFHGMSDADFDHWVQGVKTGGGTLDRKIYTQLAAPSEREPVHHYASVEPDLYSAILNECVDRSKPCLDVTMAADASAHDPMSSMRHP
jgi:cytochrome o ubiquinol oxidase subunit II